MNFVNEIIIQREIGSYCNDFLDTIREYVRKTGKIDLYVSPEDYIQICYNRPVGWIFGRTADNRPFIDYYGIHIIMLSQEEAAKYQILL